MRNSTSATRDRLTKCREEVANFVRIQEELLAARKKMAAGSARDKVDELLRLNREILENMKRSLQFAELEMKRSDPAPNGKSA